MHPRQEQALQAAQTATGTGYWQRANCPFCEERTGKNDTKQSWGFDLRTLRHHCFKCHSWGYFDDAPDGHMHIDVDAIEEPPDIIEPPWGFTPLAEDPGLTSWTFKGARKYLRDRGVSRQTALEANLGGTVDGFFKHRIIVPLLDGSRWTGFIAREWVKGDGRLGKYLYPKGMKRGETMFNLAALRKETDDPVVVVEGCFDALPHWPDAASCLGKPTEWQYQQLKNAKRPVVVALDGDAWSEGWSLAWRLHTEGKRAAWMHLPPLSDPGDMKSGELLTEARNALREGIKA